MKTKFDELCDLIIEDKSKYCDVLKSYILESYNQGVSDAADIADSFADYDPDRDGRMIGKNIRERLLQEK